MSYYAFGDIHGEFLKLDALIKRINIKESDVLVFLGDYIDRGTRSFDVIDLLIDLSKKHDCVFLKGNHESMFVDYLAGIHENIFIYNGGERTIKSYYRRGWEIGRNIDYKNRRIPDNHVKFFGDLKNYFETEEFIFVHAGIWPGTPLDRTPDDVLLWDRSFLFNHDNYNGKTVVCGHTPAKQVLNKKHKICVDTGACFNSMGSLTCVRLPERIFLQQGWVLDSLEEEVSVDNRETAENFV